MLLRAGFALIFRIGACGSWRRSYNSSNPSAYQMYFHSVVRIDLQKSPGTLILAVQHNRCPRVV